MRPDGRSVKEAVLAAAVQLFAEYGYHAAPLRDIADMAGIRAASIYHYYDSKQALLVEIMDTHMQRLNATLEKIVRECDDPLQCLHEAVANHIRLHTSYKAEFFIIDTEIRALEGENRTYILGLRDRYEKLLQELLRDGMERGIFRQSDVKVSSYAIIAMCTEVATWFKQGGRFTVQQVVDMYSHMITEGLLVIRALPQRPEESARI